MRKPAALLVVLLAGGLAFAQAPKRILFDHTGYEQAGTSAEWVICTASEPDPTPANPVSEQDWNGGISAWAYDLFKQGYQVQTLPAAGGRISYNDATNALDLKNYAAFIIPERYKRFSDAEKQAILDYVNNGGGLYLMGNHPGAARATSIDPNSTDAFNVFNELLSWNGGTSFGFTFVAGHGPGDANANTVSNAFTTATGPIEDAIVRGANGTLQAMDFHSYAYVRITGANAKPILSTQVAGDPSTAYFVVAATLGNGRVLAIGDSAPSDDGTTTTSGKRLHNSYWLNSNRTFHLNVTSWLASGTTSTPDTQAPTVSASASGTSGIITLSASATDDRGVAKVDFWVDGSLKGTDTTAPYAMSLDSTTLAKGNHSLVAKAYDAAGNVGSSTALSFSVSNPTSGTQILINPGFESGATGWSGTTADIAAWSGQPAHGGTQCAWLCGTAAATTETLYQQVSIPSTATSASLSFWLHIDTAETDAVVYDTLLVRVLNSSGNVLQTLGTWSNLNKTTGYVQKSFDLLAYKGQTVRIHFKGTEDSSLQTSFVVDDVTLTVK